MKFYSLEDLVLVPPAPAAVAILLVVGLLGAGRLLMRWGAPRGDAMLRVAGPLLAVAGLGALVQLLAIAGLAKLPTLRWIGIALVAGGMAESVRLVASGWTTARAIRPWTALQSAMPTRLDGRTAIAVASGSGLIFLALTLAAFGPATNGDSIDYHLGVALRILETGSTGMTPEWFDSRFVGLGEFVNAIGLAVGSDSFGSLLQVLALVILLTAIGAIGHGTERLFAWALILALPPLVFLVPSSKPMLLPAVGIAIGAALALRPSAAYDRTLISVVAALAWFAIGCKHSFLLSGGPVAALLFWRSCQAGRGRFALGALAVSFAVLVLPLWIQRWVEFGDPLSPILSGPLHAGLPGDQNFVAYLKSYRESHWPFIVNLFLPSGPTTVTAVFLYAPLVGAALVVARRAADGLVALAGAIFVIELALTQQGARFFLEPVFMLALAIAGDQRARPGPVWLGTLLPQLGVAALLAGFAALSLFPGALTAKARDAVLSRSAQTYDVAKWLDGVLPRDAVILTGLRAVVFLPRPWVAMNGLRWVSPGDAAGVRFYLTLLKRADPTVAVVAGGVPPAIAACFGSLIAGPRTFIEGMRNPFNRHPYQVAVYAIDWTRCRPAAGAADRDPE